MIIHSRATRQDYEIAVEINTQKKVINIEFSLMKR